MTKDPFHELLGRGKTTSISLDPQMKNEITRATLDTMIREVKRHLASKKRVHLVIVKE